jgi:hypothetical protein
LFYVIIIVSPKNFVICHRYFDVARQASMANLLLINGNKLADRCEFQCEAAFKHELAFCKHNARHQTYMLLPTCPNMMEFALIIIEKEGDKRFNFLILLILI